MPSTFKALFVVISLVLLLATVAFAQGPDSLWHRAYGDTLSDFGFAVKQTLDGCYVTAGYMQVYNPDSAKIFADVLLVKTDSDGDTVWIQTYGGERGDGAFDVIQTADSGYAVAGYSDSYGAGDRDLYLIKTDAEGDTVWTRTYGGSRHDEYGYCVRQAEDGGYFITGDIHPKGSSESGVYLLRTNAQGDFLWSRTYNDNQHASSRELDFTRDGGCIIAGAIWEPGIKFDVYLLKTDDSGDTLWARRFGGPGGDYGQSVIATSDGSYYLLGGYSETFLVPGYDAYLLRVSAGGDSVWDRRYGGPEYDNAHSVRQTADGGFVLTGSTQSFGAGLSDIYVIRTEADGDTVWTAVYGGTGNEYGSEGWETPDGGYIFAGTANSFGPPNLNMYLVKTGPDPAGIREDDNLADTALDFRVMPNPSAAGVRIEYRLFSAREVRAAVYNLHGRQLRKLSTGRPGPGSHSMLWDGTDSKGERVSPGVYFVHFTDGEEAAARKVVMLR